MENKNVRVLIVDDDVLISETLKDYLEQLGFSQIKMTHSKEETFQLLDFWKPQVALLDIRMEELYDGLEIGQRFRDEFKIPFMYVTAHADLEMTHRILKTKPDGYITKPIRINALMVNLGMVVQRFEEVSEEIVFEIKNGFEKERIFLNDIVYLKSEKNYVEIYLESRKIVIRNTLELILHEMNQESIIRIHRSFAVNRMKILKHSNSEVRLESINLPVSRSYIDALTLLSLAIVV